MRTVCTAVVSYAIAVAPAGAGGDPVNGEALHRACLGCHGAELYKSSAAKVKTLSALRKETVKWNDRMNPKLSRQEVDDVVAYLNRDFYRLSR